MIARLARFYLVALAFFVWGVAAARFEVFPWRPLNAAVGELSAYVRGHPAEATDVVGRIANDVGLAPERFIRPYAADTSDYTPVDIVGMRSRRDAARLWLADDAGNRYRLIVGAFDFEKAFWGAVLLGPDGGVVHTWHLSGEIPALNDIDDQLKTLYGIGFYRDGSVVFNMQEVNGGLVKVNACSETEWIRAGTFHHVVAPTADGTAFWTFGGEQGDLHPSIELIDAATGETRRTIDMAEVARANPDLFLFDLQRRANVAHATHPNDISPLPPELAGAFPGFSPGDLAISYHTTNLIFVLDPETLRIKWWYVGAGDGQHDADWRADGTIGIFNNRWRDPRRGVAPRSTIVAIDLRAHRHQTILDGRRYDFYSRTNGRQDFTEAGSVLVTSSTQGRVFEVDLDSGRLLFDFVNYYDADGDRTLHLSDAFAVDPGFFDMTRLGNCETAVADKEME